LVFLSTCAASVVPACGGTTAERTPDGGSGGQGGAIGFGGAIPLAIGGFGNGGYPGVGGIIVLAVAGYNGNGGYTGFGGRVIALGVAGFAYPPGGAFGSGGRKGLDASVDAPSGGTAGVDAGADAAKDSGNSD
jgi:hypothetical protein